MAKITINDLEVNKALDREAMGELRGKGLNTVNSKMKGFRKLQIRTMKFLDDMRTAVIRNMRS